MEEAVSVHVIRARNVHCALPVALDYLFEHGRARGSRNGPVLVAPGPVVTEYERPRERVLFWRERDANPFFHLFEALWMLAGRDDVAFVRDFVKRMETFSDDGVHFHGAYGRRWRGFPWRDPSYAGPGYSDQLPHIAERLRSNPDDRRCVVAMWDPERDLGSGSLDVPCNTHAYFSRDDDGRLDLTVSCRSNDVVWGAYGANAVHFSLLQEYLAARVGCPVGRLVQFSNNWHGYLATIQPLEPLADEARAVLDHRPIADPYASGLRPSPPLIETGEDPDEWDAQLRQFLRWVEWSGENARRDSGGVSAALASPFLVHVALPMIRAHRAHRLRDYDGALEEIERCHADDWRVAGRDWLDRRRSRWEQRRDRTASS